MQGSQRHLRAWSWLRISAEKVFCILHLTENSQQQGNEEETSVEKGRESPELEKSLGHRGSPQLAMCTRVALQRKEESLWCLRQVGHGHPSVGMQRPWLGTILGGKCSAPASLCASWRQWDQPPVRQRTRWRKKVKLTPTPRAHRASLVCR